MEYSFQDWLSYYDKTIYLSTYWVISDINIQSKRSDTKTLLNWEYRTTKVYTFLLAKLSIRLISNWQEVV